MNGQEMTVEERETPWREMHDGRRGSHVAMDKELLQIQGGPVFSWSESGIILVYLASVTPTNSICTPIV